MHEVSSLCVLDWKELRSVRAPSALNKILPNFCFCIAYLGIFSMLHSSINKIILILGGGFICNKSVTLQNFLFCWVRRREKE